MSPQAGYLLVNEVVPRLISAIPNAVPITFPDDPHEIIADGTAMAAQLIDSCERNGKRVVRSPTRANGRYRKQPKEVTCGNISYYVIQKLRCGRRSTGSSVVDAHAPGTQITGTTRLTSLDETAAIDEDTGGELTFNDVLSRDEDDPAVRASRRIDWQTFMAGLSARDQAVIEFLIGGTSSCTMARKLGVCSSTIQHRKRSLAKAIVAFMGDDILVQVSRKPQYMASLDATRERQAVRYERSHL